VSYAATLLRQKLRAVAALADGEPVPSPCNNVCRIDPATGYCEGCLRTIDEVAAWGSLDDRAKREIWQRLGARAGP